MILSNSVFGLYHIIALVISIGAIVAGCIFGRKLSFNKALTILLIIGVASELIKVCSYIMANEETLNGYLPKTDLPFHLCSIQIILMIILKLTKNENLKHTIISFMIPTCLIGGFAALILATSSSLNMPVITVQYFMYHSAIIWFAIFNLLSDEFKLDIKGYINTILLLLAVFLIAIYLNSWIYDGRVDSNGVVKTSINFMYVVAPPMDGLPFLTKKYGWLVYIVHYASLAIVCVTLCYLKPIINYFKNRKNNEEVKEEKIETENN